jgi:CBS domain containing-hemolysin-like protein
LIVLKPAGNFVLASSSEIDKIERLVDLDLEDEEYTTAAGMVISETGNVPKEGEKFELRGLDIEILKADEKKIHLLRIQRLQPKEAEDTSGDQTADE